MTGIRPLDGPGDLDPLLDLVGDARYVLLGEASHGTHEYYRWRAELTRRLVEEEGFDMVVVEGDWPDCAAVDGWVRGGGGDERRDAADVLQTFRRWPTWMWANREVAQLATWMRRRNRGLPPDAQVAFHGFDVYSLWESMQAVVEYLSAHEPDAVEPARAAARCFEPYREDPQGYAWASRIVPESCEDAVVDMLAELLADRAGDGAGTPRDARFAAEQNAMVVHGAERYYRAMVRGGPDAWNVRDTHMVDTLDRLVAHRGEGAKAIVWAHNTHVGDARATDMADAGMVNVGQLVRERHAADGVVAVGQAGHRGDVIAGPRWGGPMRRMDVPPARRGSVEDLLHAEVGHDALLVLDGDGGPGWLREPRPHRAIGVVYHPEREAYGNYVPTVLADRYDAVLSFEGTHALRPLGPEAPQPDAELAAFPSGV